MELTCQECGRKADPDARGWRTVLTHEEDGSVETATYCPECAAREFGDDEDESADSGASSRLTPRT